MSRRLLSRRDQQWSRSHSELRWSRYYGQKSKLNTHRREKRVTTRAERRAEPAVIADFTDEDDGVAN